MKNLIRDLTRDLIFYFGTALLVSLFLDKIWPKNYVNWQGFGKLFIIVLVADALYRVWDQFIKPKILKK